MGCVFGVLAQSNCLTVYSCYKRGSRGTCVVLEGVSCKPLFVAHRILTLPSLFVLESVCIIHKKYKRTITTDEQLYNTRQIYNVGLPIPHSSLVRRSIVFNSRQLFNHLPLAMKQIENEKRFRSQVKELLITKAYYEISEFLGETF